MMMKKNKLFGSEYLVASLMVIVASVVIGWYLSRSVVISEITLTGNVMADPDAVIQASGLKEGLSGDSIAFLDVIEKIETLPWVETAYVSLTQSGRVRIRVQEEHPMALLVDNNRSALVTDSGIVLPIVLGKRIDVPLLYGFPIAEEVSQSGKPDTLRSGYFDQAQAFLTTLRPYESLYAMISEVMVTEADGVVALTDEHTVRLTFGHDDFDKRIRKWQAFQSQVISEKGMDHVRSLDLRFRDQIVAR